MPKTSDQQPVSRVRVQAYLLPAQAERLEQIREEEHMRSMSVLVETALRQFEADRGRR